MLAMAQPLKKTATLRARIDPALKQRGDDILAALGISQSDFLTMSYRQLVMQRGLPFDLRLPNEETATAMREDLSRAPRHAGPTKALFDDILIGDD